MFMVEMETNASHLINFQITIKLSMISKQMAKSAVQLVINNGNRIRNSKIRVTYCSHMKTEIQSQTITLSIEHLHAKRCIQKMLLNLTTMVLPCIAYTLLSVILVCIMHFWMTGIYPIWAHLLWENSIVLHSKTPHTQHEIKCHLHPFHQTTSTYFVVRWMYAYRCIRVLTCSIFCWFVDVFFLSCCILFLCVSLFHSFDIVVLLWNFSVFSCSRPVDCCLLHFLLWNIIFCSIHCYGHAFYCYHSVSMNVQYIPALVTCDDFDCMCTLVCLCEVERTMTNE